MSEKVSIAAEFLESWNNYMPENHITEAELRKPTKNSFTHWLMLILNQLHVDTSCYDRINVEIGSRQRDLRFKLIATVNYFLTIPDCQEKMELNYFNLINPTFKIVFTTLRYLLNYSFFVNMIYSTTISECAKKVEEYEILRNKKNQIRKEIEESKIEEENCLKLCRDYEKRLPQQKSTIAALQAKEEKLLKEIQMIEQEIEQTDMILLELKSQKQSLEGNIVCQQEAESIYTSRETVIRQLAEQDDYIMAGRQKLKDHSVSIEKIRYLNNKMEALQSEFAIDTSDVKELKKNLTNQSVALNNLKYRISKLNSGIESLSQNIKSKKETIETLNKKKNDIEATLGSKDQANLEVLKQQVHKLHKISIKEDELLTIRERIKCELDLLFTLSTNVIKQMSMISY